MATAKTQAVSGDPSAVARRVEAITDILQVVGQYQRMPIPPGSDASEPLQVAFSQTPADVQVFHETQLIVSLRFRCVIATPDSDFDGLASNFHSETAAAGLRFRAEAAYVVSYIISGGTAPTRGELDAFGQVNVPLNIVPYWREFLDSSLRRAGMPPVLAPVHKTDPAAATATGPRA